MIMQQLMLSNTNTQLILFIMAPMNLVNIGSGNDLLLDVTKPLPDPVLMDH